MTNVVPLVSSDLAAEFHAAEARVLTAEDDWIEAHVALAILYARGRAQHDSDPLFGHWLASVGARANSDNRAAYVAMGRYPDIMRTVLAASKSRSMRTIYADNRNLFRRPAIVTPEARNPGDNRPQMTAPESRPAGTLHLPVHANEAEPAPAPARTMPPPRVPWLIETLGPALGQPLWDRLNGSSGNTLATLRPVLRMRNGRAALQRYAEVLAAHPEWTPSKSARKLSIMVLHTGLRDNYVAATFVTSPANLHKIVDIAIDYAGRLQRQQEERDRPRSVPAHTDNFEELRQHYRRNQATMEQPLHDEDIFICGVRVREKGVNTANYVMEWNCAYWILLLMAHGQNMTSFSRDQIRDMGTLLGRISGLIFQAMDPHTGQFLQGVATALNNYDGPPLPFEQLFKRAERRMRMVT